MNLFGHLPSPFTKGRGGGFSLSQARIHQLPWEGSWCRIGDGSFSPNVKFINIWQKRTVPNPPFLGTVIIFNMKFLLY